MSVFQLLDFILLHGYFGKFSVVVGNLFVVVIVSWLSLCFEFINRFFFGFFKQVSFSRLFILLGLCCFGLNVQLTERLQLVRSQV